MPARAEHPAEEIKRLQRCISDLISVLALPAIWSGRDPFQIARTLLDTLLGMLRLDLVYVRLKDPAGQAPIEMVRVATSNELSARQADIGQVLDNCLGPDPGQWAPMSRSLVGELDMSVVPSRLGMHGEIGIVVAGSRRPDFPEPTEQLLLAVAANQAAIGLQEARLLAEQRRVADELDRRVAQRTEELAAANEELRKGMAERRRAEELLRRSEAFLAEGQRLSSTGAFSWRVATDEIMWSAEMYRIFGIDQGVPVTLDLIGSRLHPEDFASFQEMLARQRRDGRDFEHDHRLLMPDHSVKYLHEVCHAGRDPEDRLLYIGAVQDVTERRLSEEALGRARSDLAHVSRVTSLGAMTASIAHEVSQPLSGIVTNASTCLRMLAADPPDIAGAIETARRTIRDGNRASDVITRLRALFAKKDTATEPVDLNEATREVIALSQSNLQRNRVLLRANLADDLPPVTGDRVQLQQVILNLLLNATDAMSGVDDRPRRLEITTARDVGDRVRLAVQDAGVGFEHGTDRLFEPFYTTKSGGMGIGLSVSRSIVESHHGRLWAAANEGPGATFSFSIPRRADATTRGRA
jgi:signal transduction histidine kinase